MDDRLEELIESALRHREKVIGAAAGLFVGWLIVSFGLFKTIFVGLCAVIGYYLGGRRGRNV